MVSKIRAVRIAERIRQDLAEMLLLRIHDPRLVGVTVTDVEVDRELAYATVFVSSIEGSMRASEILAGLEHARGYLRSELAQHIDLRHFPQLRFRWDPTPERADAIEKLLSSLNIVNSGQASDPDEEDAGPARAQDG